MPAADTSRLWDAVYWDRRWCKELISCAYVIYNEDALLWFRRRLILQRRHDYVIHAQTTNKQQNKARRRESLRRGTISRIVIFVLCVLTIDCLCGLSS